MNYHAHIPAGITFAACGCLIAHVPLSVPILIGGAIGGALPDIDHPSGNGAISSMGEKAGGIVQNATRGRVRIFRRIGEILDTFVAKPLVQLWLLLAQHVFAPLYMRLYEAFGQNIGWSGGDPSEHRGGLTHSLVFMLFVALIMWPVSDLLVHSRAFWYALELGILSHLFADSVCKSGIKWFWPWLPSIGFSDETHERGNGIRLIPVSWCMSTGKCPTREDYLSLGQGTKRYKEMRKAYYKEKGWQWAFKATMVASIVCCLAGLAGGTGTFAWGETVIPTSTRGMMTIQAADQEQVAVDSEVVSELADGDAQDSESDGDDDEGAADSMDTLTSIGEHEGPTSLTQGDVAVIDLPKGIIKLPDETLWVIGVGKVSAETLASPTLTLTNEEKDRLLVAATAQRIGGIPSATNTMNSATNMASNIGTSIGNAGNTVSGLAGDASGTIGNSVSDATRDFNSGYVSNNSTGNSGNAVTNTLRNLFSDSSSVSGFGFMGLTPFTSKATN